MPTLLGKEQEKYRDEPLFFTRREGGIRYGGLTIQAVRLGDWKLLQNSPFEARELYNLSEDPKEQNNVIDEYQHIARSEKHTSELQSRAHIVCRLLLE